MLSNDAWYKGRLEDAKAKLAQVDADLEKAKAEAKDPVEQAKELWAEHYENAPTHRTQENHFIGGAVLRWWAPMREASRNRLNIYTLKDADTGKRLVGVQIPSGEVSKLLARISGGQSAMTPKTFSEDVLRNGTEYRLEGNIRVTRGRIAGNPIVRLHPPSAPIQEGLKQLGVLYERGIQPVCIPSGAQGSTVSIAC